VKIVILGQAIDGNSCSDHFIYLNRSLTIEQAQYNCYTKYII